jgi:hypothetical protein
MPFSPLPTSPAPSGLTFARARLYLGISGVGVAVLAAALLLIAGTDVLLWMREPSGVPSLGPSLITLALAFAAMLLFFFASDLLGGAWIVRQRPTMTHWLGQWARGAAVQWLVWLGVAATLMVATASAGIAGTIGAFVIWQMLLAHGRGVMARLIAHLPTRDVPAALRDAASRAGLDPTTLRVVDSADEGFVGGWSGIWPRTLYVPLHWASLPADALTAQLVRRRVTATSGAHVRGVFGALLWNTLGLVVVLWATGVKVTSASAVLTVAAGLTLWAFLGVLVLPTMSRQAVFAVDAAAAEHVPTDTVRASITALDRWQDDEAARAPWVERIFHPVPSRANRLARLAAHDDGGAPIPFAHHLARHALWMGWGAMTPISRVVHCNAGRPALWAMLPGD